MLDIRPISFHSYTHSRPGGCGSDEFVKDGLNIVNLALAGCMDSKTVRAFLNHYGYTDGALEREGNPETGVRAIGMNRGLFARALEQAEGHSPDSIDRIQLRSPPPLFAASSAPSNGTLGLQDAISEVNTGLGDALPENPGLQDALPKDTPGLQGALLEDTPGSQDALLEHARDPRDVLPRDPSLQGALPQNNPGLQDALFEFQNQRLEELRGIREQAPTKTTLLQNAVRFHQIMGGAHTDTTSFQDLQDATFESAIQEFRDQAHGATLEQARTFLEDAGGDVEQALVFFGLHQSRL